MTFPGPVLERESFVLVAFAWDRIEGKNGKMCKKDLSL